MPTNAESRRQAIFAQASTPELIKSLRAMDALTKTDPTPEHKLARAWIQTELERRFPAASAAVEKAYEDPDDTTDIDQVAIVLAAIEQVP